MAQQGKLPAGAQIDLPATYKGMTGAGEIWVRPDGLPLRQIITAHFPPESDHAIDAQITVDFSDYQLAVARPAYSLQSLAAFDLRGALSAGITALGGLVGGWPAGRRARAAAGRLLCCCDRARATARGRRMPCWRCM